MTSAAQPYRAEQLAQACNLGTSTLFEASGLSTSATDVAIRPVWAGAAVAGPAYPLECSPGDNLAIHIAMEKAPRGSILVISRCCLLYTSPSPRDRTRSRMPSSA